MAGFARGVLGGANTGMSKLAASLAGGGMTEQAAFDNEMGLQTKMAQALAQMQALGAAGRAHDAQAALHGQEAAVLERRPQLADQVIASQAGVDVPTLSAWRQRLQTGTAGQVPMGPPAEDGGMGVGQAQFDPATSSKIAQAFGRLAPVLNNAKDLNPSEYAKAQGAYRDMDLGDQVLAGTRTAADVGDAQAAMGGKPRMHFDGSGLAGNLFSGAVDVSNPMAQGTIALRRDQAGAQRANAVQSMAAADNSRASAGLHRAQTEQVQGAPKGQLVQTDAGPVFSDPRTGSSVPVLGPDGKPAGQKLKDIPASENERIMGNAQNISKLEQAIALLDGNKVGKMQGDKNATGWKGYLPNAVLNRMDPAGVDTRAMISDIGSLVLHERSGANVTASESPRLMPFIPLASDDAGTAKKKLERFLQLYRQEQAAFASVYSRDQGYKPSPIKPATPDQFAPNGQKIVTVDY